LRTEKACSEDQPALFNVKKTEYIENYYTTYLNSLLNFTARLLPGKVPKMMTMMLKNGTEI
jgi:hypothetical protein